MAHPSAQPSPSAMRPAALAVTDPLLVCLDCGETFPWSTSPDADRCPWCAENRTEYLGRPPYLGGAA